ncbi:hypothetical protein BT69DRAFT_957473 [Atractiella rhizophila]|nr:hypothetical protein BT69DRAFT_957473 [Atractiella rhizophila]
MSQPSPSPQPQPQLQQQQPTQAYPSAADEKARLFREAKEMANRSQSEAQAQEAMPMSMNNNANPTTNGSVQAINGAGYTQQPQQLAFNQYPMSNTTNGQSGMHNANPTLQHAPYPTSNNILTHAPYPTSTYPMPGFGYTSYGHTSTGSTSSPMPAPSPTPSATSGPPPTDEKAQVAAYYKAKEETERFRSGLAPSSGSSSTSLTPNQGGANLHSSPSVRNKNNFYPTNAIPANPTSGNTLYSQSVVGSANGNANSNIIPGALLPQATGTSSTGNAATTLTDERMRYYEAIRARDAVSNPGAAPSAAPYKSAEEEKAELKRQLEKSEITPQPQQPQPQMPQPQTDALPNYGVPPPQQRSEKAEMAAYYAAREATERFTAAEEGGPDPCSFLCVPRSPSQLLFLFDSPATSEPDVAGF